MNLDSLDEAQEKRLRDAFESYDLNLCIKILEENAIIRLDEDCSKCISRIVGNLAFHFTDQ